MLMQVLLALFVHAAILNHGIPNGSDSSSEQISGRTQERYENGRPQFDQQDWTTKFKFIGTSKSQGGAATPVNGINRSGKVFDENDYYVSINPATWDNAVRDCKNTLGPNANLVAIESEKERDELNIMLESYGSGSLYWTAGIYDASAKVWRWGTNNKVFPPWAPWGNGQPAQPGNPAMRVALYHTSRYTADWRTAVNVQLQRYICEMPSNEIPVPCYESNDLVIVLDGSGSVGIQNFEKAKMFSAKLASAFTVHGQSRVSFLTYSNDVRTIFGLNNNLSPAALNNAILGAAYQNSGTATDIALDAAGNQFSSYPRNVPKNVVVLTDGVSNSPSRTAAAAARLTARGIRTFSVGITPSVNDQELLTIAGGVRKHVFHAQNFDDLIKLITDLTIIVCPDKTLRSSSHSLNARDGSPSSEERSTAVQERFPNGRPVFDQQDVTAKFKFIGSSKKQRGATAVNGVNRNGGKAFDENDYYVSINPATWDNAQRDCKNTLGPNANLVAIESEKERDELNIMLESYGSGSLYWTDGIYDASVKVWRWAHNNKRLPPWAPWGVGQPAQPGNPAMRVALYHTSRYTADWRTAANIQLQRYICELPSKETPVPCYETNDLVIVLDGSGSVGSQNFEKAKMFSAKLASAFTVNPPSRVSFLTYSNDVRTILSLNNQLSPDAITSAIMAATYQNSGTATNLAIDAAGNQFSTYPSSVPKNVVVLTDGESNDPPSTAAAAARLVARGVRTFSLGITPAVNEKELLAIAGGKPGHVFHAGNFDDLVKLLTDMTIIVCPN